MKFSTKTTEFLKSITFVEGVINSKNIKSVLSNVKIEAADGKVFLSATDMEISMRTSISANITMGGETSLPAKQLSSIFKTLQFPESELEVILDSDNPTTFITDASKNSDTKFQINGMDPQEIKTIGNVDDSILVDFPCLVLKDMIRKTYFAVAQEETRFVFNGLFFRTDENDLTIVGTDGRRLAKVTRKLPSSLNMGQNTIIPHKSIRESQKLLEQAEIGKLGLTEGQFYLKVGSSELLSKLIDGNYPDYEQVIPKNASYAVRINKDLFSVVLRQALISAEEPTKQIRLEFKHNQLHITSSNPGSMQFENNMPIDYSGEEFTIGFKGDYLADVIKVIDDPEFEIHFSDPGKPVVFKDPSDDQFLSVIMPMKV